MSLIEHFQHDDCRIEVAINDAGMVDATRMCKSSGKRWGNYIANAGSAAFVEALAASTGMDVETLIVQNPRGNINNRQTWVHPKVADHLRQWLQARTRKKATTGGLVYAVTSPHVMVKIGMWTGNEESLRGRYITPYGPELELVTATVEDPKLIEGQLHCLFDAFSLGGELFHKSCWEAARMVVQNIKT